MTTSEPPNLVLVGLMGVGKSTVGAACAQRLGRRFVDVDDLIEAHEAMSVAEIFERVGADGFRERERRALRDACSLTTPLVLAPGGGAVLDPDNRQILRGAGVVVWLRAPVSVLAQRVDDSGSRPLLADGALSTLTRLEAERESAYADVATCTVWSGDLSVAETVDAVLDAFERVSRGDTSQRTR